MTGQVIPIRQGPESWVTSARLAEHLGMSERWIRDRRAEGMPHRKWGNKTRFRISACETWLEREYPRIVEMRRAS